MCDEMTFRMTRDPSSLSRREFGGLSVATSVALLLPRGADAVEATSSIVDVQTADGLADCYLAHPVEGAHPGVIIWPDARGIRSTYRLLAERLAESGYSVLVVNPYYRSQRGPVLPEGADPRQGDTMSVLGPMLAELSPATELTDAIAAVGFLHGQSVVDEDRPLGTLGFCLGGPAVFRTAAEFPTRVGAGATFHGVRLVTDQASSPHRLIPSIDAQFLIAIAEDDDEREPATKNVLRASFDAAGLEAEIDVYAGALHSWTTPDSPVHNPEQAARAWSRMLTLFAASL